MKYSLKLNQVRQVLGMEIKLETAKLKDGVTVVEYETLEIGMPVFVVSEDGEVKSPAPEGTHLLESGIEIEVDAQGIIKEISAAEAEEVEATEAPEADDTIVQVSGEEVKEPKLDVAMEDIVEKVTEKVAEKMKMIFEAVEEVAKEVATMKEEMGSMKTKMEKFSKLPASAAAPKFTDIEPAEFSKLDAKVNLIKSLRK